MYTCTLSTTGQRCIQAGASRHCRLCLGLPLSSSIMSFHQSSQTLSSSIASGRQYLHNLFTSLLSGFKSSHSDFQSIYMQYLFFKKYVYVCVRVYVFVCVHLFVSLCTTRMLKDTRRGCWIFWNWSYRQTQASLYGYWDWSQVKHNHSVLLAVRVPLQAR